MKLGNRLKFGLVQIIVEVKKSLKSEIKKSFRLWKCFMNNILYKIYIWWNMLKSKIINLNKLCSGFEVDILIN